MAQWTLTLKEIDKIIGGITDPRQAHQGIFETCGGDINVEYLGEEWGTQDIENLILSEYAFRESAFETLAPFRQYFTNTWNRGFFVLRQNLENVQKMSFENEKEVYEETTQADSTGTSSATGDGKFTDMPQQYDNTTDVGLTSRNMNTASGENTAHGEGSKNFSSTKSGNAFQKWMSLSEKNRNIIYSFVDSFNWLFVNSITVQNFRRDYLRDFNIGEDD